MFLSTETGFINLGCFEWMFIDTGLELLAVKGKEIAILTGISYVICYATLPHSYKGLFQYILRFILCREKVCWWL